MDELNEEERNHTLQDDTDLPLMWEHLLGGNPRDLIGATFCEPVPETSLYLHEGDEKGRKEIYYW